MERSRAVPTFTVVRSTSEAPGSTPAASPRLRRRPSPWPPDPDRKDPIGSSPSVVVDGQICAATQPTSTGLELVKPSRGVTTPIPRVYLPISLTAPGPSGSTGPTRLCRGCSPPPRRPPDWIASSFTLPLRRQGDGRSFTSIRKQQRLVAHSDQMHQSGVIIPNHWRPVMDDPFVARGGWQPAGGVRR